MKIAINFLPLLHFGGTKRYAELILEEIIYRRLYTNFFFIFPESIRKNIPEIMHRNSIFLPIENSLMKVVAEQIIIPRLLLNKKIKLLHQLSFSYPFMLKDKVKILTTIHDLTFIKYPDTIPFYKRFYFKKNFSFAIENSNYIIADTLSIKKEIMKFFNRSEQEIFVVPLGIGRKFKQVKEKKPKDFYIEKYFLSVGTIEPRKNYELLLEWWNKFMSKHPQNIHLVIVGKKGWNYRKILVEMKKSLNVLYLGNISEENLKYLYKNSLGYISLSKYEGFGLPVVEAAYFQKPLILSNIDVFSELCGSDEYLINNYESFEKVLLSCIKKEGFYKKLIEISHRINENYDFSKGFDKLVNIYNKLIKSG